LCLILLIFIIIGSLIQYKISYDYFYCLRPYGGHDDPEIEETPRPRTKIHPKPVDFNPRAKYIARIPETSVQVEKSTGWFFGKRDCRTNCIGRQME